MGHRVAIKHDFRPYVYIRRYTCTSSNEIFESGYPYSNVLLQSNRSIASRIKQLAILKTTKKMRKYFHGGMREA